MTFIVYTVFADVILGLAFYENTIVNNIGGLRGKCSFTTQMYS